MIDGSIIYEHMFVVKTTFWKIFREEAVRRRPGASLFAIFFAQTPHSAAKR